MSTVPVTVILNLWKRQYLEEQLDSLLRQTMLPQEIWLVQCGDHIDVSNMIKKYSSLFSELYLIKSSLDLKYFGRFSIANHVNSPYIWFLDDDVIPGKEWLERSCRKCESLNAIISCTGRIIPKDNFVPEKVNYGRIRDYFIGDCFDPGEVNYCLSDTLVDFACNSYFIRSSWIREFWSIWPFTFQSGEDIHLSASLKIRRNIPTYVLEQLTVEASGNLRKKYGGDQYSSWRKP